MSSELWTEAEKAYARMLRTKRWRRKRIADALGKTDLAIKGFFNREDISRGMRDPVRHIQEDLSIFEARDRRASEPRAAGGMQGEPPFSQSALARPPARGLIERRESVTD